RAIPGAKSRCIARGLVGNALRGVAGGRRNATEGVPYSAWETASWRAADLRPVEWRQGQTPPLARRRRTGSFGIEVAFPSLHPRATLTFQRQQQSCVQKLFGFKDIRRHWKT